MNKYRCRISGTEDYEEYYDVDHIAAAKRYALDLSEIVELKDPEQYIKNIKVEVVAESGDAYNIEISFIHIRKN
jgi:spore coat polysaccharide biosynthesis protein SpsF (cytidylyltransferase family)